jgi:hypothetical protein
LSPWEVSQVEGRRDRCSWVILAQDFCEEASDFGEERKKGKNLGGDERTLGVAALRELRDGKPGGNDAPWKAWKTPKPKASFPLFPPGLEIRQKSKAPDFHISTAPTAAYLTRKGQT